MAKTKQTLEEKYLELSELVKSNQYIMTQFRQNYENNQDKLLTLLRNTFLSYIQGQKAKLFDVETLKISISLDENIKQYISLISSKRFEKKIGNVYFSWRFENNMVYLYADPSDMNVIIQKYKLQVEKSTINQVIQNIKQAIKFNEKDTQRQIKIILQKAKDYNEYDLQHIQQLTQLSNSLNKKKSTTKGKLL